jgi:hypothetical protein
LGPSLEEVSGDGAGSTVDWTALGRATGAAGDAVGIAVAPGALEAGDGFAVDAGVCLGVGTGVGFTVGRGVGGGVAGEPKVAVVATSVLPRLRLHVGP